ncbi:hypothetical protein BS78_07G098200 [Paspalum vaginatum]|nr:hypothetical protein BS78_07G098200 [Paspalum vaginatum]
MRTSASGCRGEGALLPQPPHTRGRRRRCRRLHVTPPQCLPRSGEGLDSFSCDLLCLRQLFPMLITSFLILQMAKKNVEVIMDMTKVNHLLVDDMFCAKEMARSLLKYIRQKQLH